MADVAAASCCAVVTNLVLGTFIFILCYFLIFPNHPGVHITDASLTSPNTTHHHYDLALTIKIKNRSGYFKDYNKNIKLVAFCNNNLYKPIGTAEVIPFGQNRKKTKVFTALTFKGEEGGDFQACGTTASNNGEYDDIVVKVYISNVYYVMGPNVKIGDNWLMESEFTCNLKVPLIDAGADASTTSSTSKSFTDTKCKSTFELYH